MYKPDYGWFNGRLTWTILAFFVENIWARDSVVVRTPSGPIEGKVETVMNKEIYTFFGVPFARPPVGDLRFRPPKMVQPWKDVLRAFEPAKACMQGKDVEFPGFRGAEMWNVNTEMSEDCLYLNIWAPKNAVGATVMVWLYGGGFWYGSASLTIYDARGLAALGDVIVVNVNYRMGTFGFLFLDHPDVPGNVGLLDQQLALRWLRENVRSLGGDPSRIALFGESAGAASIVAHMVAPSSRGLFRNGILQSGSLDNPWAMQTPDAAFKKSAQLTQVVGCGVVNATVGAGGKAGGSGDGGRARAARCLRRLDAKTLSDALFSIRTGFLEFPLVIVSRDKAGFFDDDAFQMLRNGEYEGTNLMIGINADEGIFWLIYYLKKYISKEHDSLINESAFNDSVDIAFSQYLNGIEKRAVKFEYWNKKCSASPTFYRDALNQMVGDYFFTCDSLWLADDVVRRKKGSVYVYHFEQRSTNNPWPSWMGVMHGYEIEYVFGLPVVYPANFTDPYEYNFSRDVIGYWKSFLETGEPKLPYKDDNWPAYDLLNKSTFILKSGPQKASVIRALKSSECDAWRLIRDAEFDKYSRQILHSSASHGSKHVMYCSPVQRLVVSSMILFSHRLYSYTYRASS